MRTATLPITFFHTDEVERQTAQPIATEAVTRGHSVRFSTDILEPCVIGVYCQHESCPRHADFSVVMLHDLAQGHNRWPDIWHNEPWDHFDLGILPDPSWSARWQACSAAPYTRPRLGVFELGWPKADALFPQSGDASEDSGLRRRLNLRHPHTILYAPSWENDGKQEDFVQSLKGLPVNLLLKQAPWSPAYPEILSNIAAMNLHHRNLQENIHIIDPALGIMDCLAIADLVVSEESSVLIEALLLNIPGIAVTDWPIPDCRPPRPPSVPFPFLIKTPKSALKETVRQVLADLGSHKKRLIAERDQQFSLLGSSSAAIIDVITAGVHGEQPRIAPLTPQFSLRPEPPWKYWFRQAKTGKIYLKNTFTRHLP